MPRFVCKAGNTQGQTLTVNLNCPDKAAALAELESRGLVPLDVTVLKDSGRLIKTFSKVSSREILVFTKQLFVLIRAGLPMVQALKLLSEDVSNRYFKRVIDSLVDSVDSGESLSEAMYRHPEVFEPIFIHTVRAGEEGSRLEDVLEQLIGFQDSSLKLKKRIINSMIYPAILVGVSGVIIIFLIGYVVPSFALVFSELDAKLPWMTEYLLAFSNHFKALLPFLFILFIGLVFLYGLVIKIEGTRKIIDRIKLLIPLWGTLIEKISVLRMCQVLKLLIVSGVPLVDAVRTVAATITNFEYRTRFERVADYISVGNSFSDSLRKFRLGRIIVSKLINVGEKSSDLPAMLDNISELYQDELNSTIELLLALIEPALLIVMGVVACLIILSLFIPILQMSMVIR